MSEIKCSRCDGRIYLYLECEEEGMEEHNCWGVCFECRVETRDPYDHKSAIWHEIILFEKRWCSKDRQGDLFLIDSPWQERMQAIYMEWVDDLAREEIVEDA